MNYELSNYELIAQSLVHKFTSNQVTQFEDYLAVEEPLEIQLRYGTPDNRQRKSIAVTMRTPGNDAQLAIGFLFTEGIIFHPNQIVNTHTSNDESNHVIIDLHPDTEFNINQLHRHFYTTSSCGVCGKSSIEAIRTNITFDLASPPLHLPSTLLHTLPHTLRNAQTSFAQTGGIHAAGLFDTSGNLQIIHEDVGRHNALDKLIGTAFQQELLPLNKHILLVSGRASFELVQKALMAGIRVMAAVGSPSSLAVQLAEEYDMTLIGFLRDERFNVYTGAYRLTNEKNI